MNDKLSPKEVVHKRLIRDIVFKMVYACCVFKNVDDDVIDMILDDKAKRTKTILLLDEEDREYVKSKVANIMNKQEFLDEIIQKFLVNWSMDRIFSVDLALLRMSVHDIYFDESTPPNVVISEAVLIAQMFNDPKSKSFINGILSSVLKDYNEKN